MYGDRFHSPAPWMSTLVGCGSALRAGCCEQAALASSATIAMAHREIADLIAVLGCWRGRMPYTTWGGGGLGQSRGVTTASTPAGSVLHRLDRPSSFEHEAQRVVSLVARNLEDRS